ncbi:MAG TPA: hypothetical protein VMU51_38415, partial [Mycobacteriales bacterium]|nr:hypothetical protein [Mycobacteriales bacterium]
MVATEPDVRQSDLPAPAGTARRHGRPRRPGAGLTPYTFVLPFFVVFGAFGLFPLIYTAWVSLHKVDFGTPEK